jgi:hypothetical protein
MIRNVLVVPAALIAFVVPAAAQKPPVQRSALHDYRVVTVADSLENPWSITFLPGGDMLFTERSGRLRIVRKGKLLPEPVAGVPKVRGGGQGGLLEVLPHPSFAANRMLYLSYAKTSADPMQGTTAVVRAKLENDRLTDVHEIFDAKVWTPRQPSRLRPRRVPVHHPRRPPGTAERESGSAPGAGSVESLRQDHPPPRRRPRADRQPVREPPGRTARDLELRSS